MSIAVHKHPGNIKSILLLLQHDTIPSTSFGDDTSVQLLNHAEVEHSKAIEKLIDENLINLTSENTFLAAFGFVFKRAGSVQLAEKILSSDSYPQIEQLYKEAVHYSAKNNWPNILSKLLEKRVDVNALTEGETPLYLACKRGKTEIVKLLLSHGADPNIATVGPHPHTYPIQAACRCLHYDVVKLLLEYNADVNVRGRSDHTVLHCELIQLFIPYFDKRRDLVQLLLDAGADVNAASEEGETPFYIACSKGFESVVEKMLECGAKVDGNSVQKLPLVAACENKHMSVVQLLLTNGANPNLQEDNDCYSLPLHIAAISGDIDLLELLLKHGAEVDITDRDGDTALRRTIVKTYSSGDVIPVIDILLDNKADVNKENKDGKTPLYFAVLEEDLLGVVNKMLEIHGGNPNAGSPNIGPLVIACAMESVELVDTLLKHGADPNVTVTWTSYSDSKCIHRPLSVAVDKGNTDIIALLLNAGANVNGETSSPAADVDADLEEFELLACCCMKSISLCQAAVLAGYVPSDEELQHLQSFADRDDEESHLFQQLVNWLNEDRQQVPSLQRQCRVVIRRQLSAAVLQSILPAIDKLPLPTALKLYSKFDGPLTEVDLNECMPIVPTSSDSPSSSSSSSSSSITSSS